MVNVLKLITRKDTKKNVDFLLSLRHSGIAKHQHYYKLVRAHAIRREPFT